ncbi:hypothetical protein L2E82_48269 [Cichorium intybus]|uniref:Uncharacterized protein n=1 Tax=Cichorium intybus TaxID=13427 RepID=A0ACB8YY16_CICIN|nr:hypothetical protein L2E82_48269 [Cichorium intybus]
MKTLLIRRTQMEVVERDELVRKGILTLIHNLRRYECHIEELGQSQTNEEGNDLSSTSIARAVKSISEAEQSCPTTKLLDLYSLPRLDAPTHPFQRLKTPFKIPRSLDNEEGNKLKDTKESKGKRRGLCLEIDEGR